MPGPYYTPPPQAAPNLFASFLSEFTRTRNPWAQELFFRRLDAMGAQDKSAALADLAKQRRALTEEFGLLERATEETGAKRFDSIVDALAVEGRSQVAAGQISGDIAEQRIRQETALQELQQPSEKGRAATEEALSGLSGVFRNLQEGNEAAAFSAAQGIANTLQQATQDDQSNRGFAASRIQETIRNAGVSADDQRFLMGSFAGLGAPTAPRPVRQFGAGLPAPSGFMQELQQQIRQGIQTGDILGGDAGARTVETRQRGPVPVAAPPTAAAAPAGEFVTPTAPGITPAPTAPGAPPVAGVTPAQALVQQELSILDQMREDILAGASAPPAIGRVGDPIFTRPSRRPVSRGPETGEEAADLFAALQARRGQRRRAVAEERAQAGLPTTATRLAEEATGLRTTGRGFTPVTPTQEQERAALAQSAVTGGRPTPAQEAVVASLAAEPTPEEQGILSREERLRRFSEGAGLEEFIPEAVAADISLEDFRRRRRGRNGGTVR